jgi:large subunit ribosomal protein L7/L12
MRYVRPELANAEGCEVVLISYPQDKLIPVIKEVREITGYGLALAKEITENAPQWLKKGLTLQEAVEIRKRLEAVGAVAEVR